MKIDLFDEVAVPEAGQELIAPLRHLITPGGYTMSVAMSNCGALGWVSDRSGYRYEALDPLSGRPWLAMPARWMELAEGKHALLGSRRINLTFRHAA